MPFSIAPKSVRTGFQGNDPPEQMFWGRDRFTDPAKAVLPYHIYDNSAVDPADPDNDKSTGTCLAWVQFNDGGDGHPRGLNIDTSNSWNVRSMAKLSRCVYMIHFRTPIRNFYVGCGTHRDNNSAIGNARVTTAVRYPSNNGIDYQWNGDGWRNGNNNSNWGDGTDWNQFNWRPRVLYNTPYYCIIIGHKAQRYNSGDYNYSPNRICFMVLG